MAKNIPERRLKEQQHEPYYTQEWNVPAPLMESGMSFNGQPFPYFPVLLDQPRRARWVGYRYSRTDRVVRARLDICDFITLNCHNSRELLLNNFKGEHPAGNLSFNINTPIICKTAKFIDESDNSSCCVLVFKKQNHLCLVG
jgi:hypothetical protein